MENDLTEEDLATLKEYYKIFRDSSTGNITLESLQTIMACMGPIKTDEEVASVFAQYDTTQRGSLTYDELVECMKQELHQTPHRVSLEEEFKKLDKNKDGFITAADLREVITNLGLNIPDDEIEGMIAEAAGTDGLVDIDKFTKLFTLN
ncbi:calmodulin-like [Teleopsis dalmanni]|uniref:calmodulin-like n=1 Tax=Teleopsis dalmanni TaxID=139649 RepID=UPI0018CC96FA|nr:calmodulin-like [Teleopsis dalmanni]